jgi:hypothetical protein
MALGLIGYTGSRTVHLVQTTLPADAHVLGYLALFALDGGIVIWCLMFLYGARGNWQRGIALLMVLVDFTGVVVTMAADTQIQASKNGVVGNVGQDLSNGAIWFVIIIIALNVAGVIFTHLTDPDHLKMQAEEEARGKIEAAAIRQISLNADVLAAKLAPVLGTEWVNDMTAQYTARDQHNKQTIEGKKPKILATKPARNVASPKLSLNAMQTAVVPEMRTEELKSNGIGDWLGAFFGSKPKPQTEIEPDEEFDEEELSEAQEAEFEQSVLISSYEERIAKLEAMLAANGNTDFLSETSQPAQPGLPIKLNGKPVNRQGNQQ